MCLVCVCSFCLINFVRNTENPSAVRTDFEQTGVVVISRVLVLFVLLISYEILKILQLFAQIFEQIGVVVISGVPVLMTPWESERC